MQRVFIYVGSVVIAVLAIYLAFQELNEQPTVEAEQEAQEEVGPARQVVVRIKDFSYRPDNVSLRAGQSVQWVNVDDVAHTVTKAGGKGEKFRSGRIAPGASYGRVFVDIGVFKYKCSIHPRRMRGTVTVLGD